MVTNNNIISFGQHQNQGLETMQQKAIISCRLIITKLLPSCFDFFSHLDNSLFKLAEQAQSNTQQEEYFAVMRHFRVQQDSIKQQFTNLVLSDYDNFWTESLTSPTQIKNSSKGDTSPELSLMQNDILEEEIALEKITTKGSHDCRDEIYQLEKRFASMLDTHKLIDNPLSLSRITLHLKTVITPLTEDISIKLVAYKQFEQYSISALATVYQSLNDELIKQGILPNLHHKTRRKAASSEKKQPLSNSDHEQNDDFIEEHDDTAIFDELRRLLNRSQHSQPASHTNTSNTAQLNTLVSILSNLQHQTDLQPDYNDNGELVLPDLQQTLRASLNKKQEDGTVIRQSMSSIDEDTLNIISFLFEFILEDAAIPSPIRALLARLQLPMLKVAITDKTFFSKKNHTARRLLNNLAKVSTGWDYTNGTDDLLFKQIDSIVNAILTQFDTDIQIFDDLNLQLKQFINQQEQSSKITEQRIATATEGHEKLALSQQEVDKTINQLLAQYSPVPKTVIALIDEGWKKVLRLRYLQKGKKSPEWKEGIDLLDKLLWSVKPKSDPDARKELIAMIPYLVKTLRTNLSGASFNQYKITKLFKELQGCHLKSLNGNDYEKSELQSIKEISEISNINEHDALNNVPSDKKQLSDEEALEKAKKLAIGSWLEVTENDQMQRIKFSWRSNLTGRCLFVTYQGLKAAELTLSELASWFQQKQAVIFNQSDIPLMDRALVSMKNIIDQKGKSE